MLLQSESTGTIQLRTVIIDGEKKLLKMKEIVLPESFIIDRRVIYCHNNARTRQLDIAVPSLALTFSITPNIHAIHQDLQGEADKMVETIRTRITSEIEKIKGAKNAN